MLLEERNWWRYQIWQSRNDIISSSWDTAIIRQHIIAIVRHIMLILSNHQAPLILTLVRVSPHYEVRSRSRNVSEVVNWVRMFCSTHQCWEWLCWSNVFTTIIWHHTSWQVLQVLGISLVVWPYIWTIPSISCYDYDIIERMRRFPPSNRWGITKLSWNILE